MCYCVLSDSHSDWYEVESQCHFNPQFVMAKRYSAFLHVFIVFCICSFEKCLFCSFAHFFIASPQIFRLFSLVPQGSEKLLSGHLRHRETCRLSVHVPVQILILESDSQCDGIWSWGLGDVIRSWRWNPYEWD
jgi:hypothetical protein